MCLLQSASVASTAGTFALEDYRLQATTVELLALFDRDIRYVVPIFQRNYRWNEQEHWGPLWADARGIAEDILDFGDGPDTSDHFLGAIVCEQQDVFGRDAQAVSLIDGQQRLTTLQLLLSAAQRVAEARGFGDDAAYIRALRENKETVAKGRQEHRFKVWPNVADRVSFCAAMDGDGAGTRPGEAIRYFADAIHMWLDVGDEEDPLDDEDHTPAERMEALVTALTRHLKIVKIDLEASDNAQLIFETLNARGERLSDADLIRNHLFRLADEQKADVEELHRLYWQPFEAPRWSERVAHGRHQRERLLLFLNYWLSMRLLNEVPAGAIFRNFKNYIAQPDLTPEAVMQDVAAYARVFDSFENQTPDSAAWWFFRRVSEMDLVTVYPVLLWLFGQTQQGAAPAECLHRALRAIESFLVRRLIRRDSTRSYGDVFIRVLKAAADGPADRADRRIIELLARTTAELDRWPTDEDMRSAVLSTNVYKLKQSRLKMVLEGIDREMVSGGQTETMTLGHNLWIEHLLPQAWRQAPGWALPDGLPDPTRTSLERDHLLHTLGNLTLTTARLDIGLSNRPWVEKIEQIQKHGSLALNRELVDRHPAAWDEAAIHERGLRLADMIVAIWPGPDAMLASLPPE
jgi:hypothetical protein